MNKMTKDAWLLLLVAFFLPAVARFVDEYVTFNSVFPEQMSVPVALGYFIAAVISIMAWNEWRMRRKAVSRNQRS